MLQHETNFHILPTSCIVCVPWHKTNFIFSQPAASYVMNLCTTPLHDADNSCDILVPSGNSCRDVSDWGMPPNYGMSHRWRIVWNSALIMHLHKWPRWNQNDWLMVSMPQIPSWQASSFKWSNFPHFMEHKFSLPYLQQPATCVFPEPD
jgi:hypothetical protein